jgi:hypothetical protein
MNERNIFKASGQQEEMWLHCQHTSTWYWNFLVSRAFKGKFHVPVFRHSLDIILRRHTGLRTRFVREKSVLYQVIEDSFDIDEVLQVDSTSCGDENEFYEHTLQATKQMLQHPFRLNRDLLFHVRVFCFEDIVYIVILFNHIICDHISTNVFWNELVHCYNCLSHKAPIDLKPCTQYHEYAQYQEHFLQSSDSGIKKAYWEEKLGRSMPLQQLPFRKSMDNACLIVKEMAIPQQLMLDLRSLALRKKVIFSAIFELAYFIVLAKYCGQKTISILNIYHCRSWGGQKNFSCFGLFADTLLNTITLEGNDTLQMLLLRVHAEIQNSINNSEIPYRDIFGCFKDQFGKNGASPLQADFNMIKINPQPATLAGMVNYGLTETAIATKFAAEQEVKLVTLEDATCSLDLLSDVSLSIKENAVCSKINLKLLCDPDKQFACEKFLNNYLDILKKIACCPDISLDEIL